MLLVSEAEGPAKTGIHWKVSQKMDMGCENYATLPDQLLVKIVTLTVAYTVACFFLVPQRSTATLLGKRATSSWGYLSYQHHRLSPSVQDPSIISMPERYCLPARFCFISRQGNYAKVQKPSHCGMS